MAKAIAGARAQGRDRGPTVDPQEPEHRSKPPTSQPTGLDVEPLVRALIERVDLSKGLLSTSRRQCGGHVLLDLEVDGVRCVLVRVDGVHSHLRARLSPREREIADMVGDGSTTREIAETLGISSWTVSAHLRRVFQKLGVSSRAAMMTALVISPEDATHVLGRLSPREQQIARMVGGGSTTREIAQTLGISLWTVSAHLRRVYTKLGVSTRAAMMTALAAAPSEPDGPDPATSLGDISGHRSPPDRPAAPAQRPTKPISSGTRPRGLELVGR